MQHALDDSDVCMACTVLNTAKYAIAEGLTMGIRGEMQYIICISGETQVIVPVDALQAIVSM